MRPLTRDVKTALILYPVFAGLILLFNFWPPATLVASAVPPKDQFAADPSGLIDLTSLPTSFDDSWNQILVKYGYQPGTLTRVKKDTLFERQFGKVEVRWVGSERSLVFSGAATEEQLVQLGTEWKSLAESFHLLITKLNGGYSGGSLWIKIESQARLSLSGRSVTVPVQRITLIGPSEAGKGNDRSWQGLIPSTLPIFKPTEGPKKAEMVREHLPAPRQPGPVKKPVIPSIKRRAKVAIIIDDVGFVKGPADKILMIPARLTWAVLPLAPFSRKYIEAAGERNFEIILHLPLEPVDRAANPGPGVIKNNFSDEEILKQLDQDLKENPEAVGINNHMGSAGTVDEHLMGVLMQEMKRRRLFFVDSFTTPKSVAGKYARIYQVPFAKRRVFIDNEGNPESKKAALRELIKVALKEGEAIGIGHVRAGTGEAIEEMLPEFVKAGVEIVPVSELVK